MGDKSLITEARESLYRTLREGGRVESQWCACGAYYVNGCADVDAHGTHTRIGCCSDLALAQSERGAL